jgi:hypothetical protein
MSPITAKEKRDTAKRLLDFVNASELVFSSKYPKGRKRKSLRGIRWDSERGTAHWGGHYDYTIPIRSNDEQDRLDNPHREKRFSAEKKKFKDFSGRLKAKVTKKKITWPTKLIYIGEATDITYRSDKQVGSLPGGVKRDYIHKLRKHGTIFSNPQGTMFIILGTKTNLKKEGITG